MQAICTISTRRLNNTTNGNPRYEVSVSYRGNDRHFHLEGRTKGDSQFAYSMPLRGEALCTWHETPSGRIVFTNIEAVKVAA